MTAPHEQSYRKREVKAHGVHVVGTHATPASGVPVAEPADTHPHAENKENTSTGTTVTEGETNPPAAVARRSLVDDLD